MTTVEKVAVGLGVAALAGGGFLIWSRWRQAGQAQRLVGTTPAPVGITSIYSTQGTGAVLPFASVSGRAVSAMQPMCSPTSILWLFDVPGVRTLTAPSTMSTQSSRPSRSSRRCPPASR